MHERALEGTSAEDAQGGERALLRGMAAGDPAALEALWQRFGPRLHGYAATCLQGDANAADDITVQAMAAAVRSLRHFDPRRGTFNSWMYGLTRRLIQGELRRRRRHAIPLDRLSGTEAVGPPEDRTSHLDAQRKVRLLAACLSPAEMEVLVLHLVHGFTVPELARLLKQSERAADSLLYRARRKARERLAQDAE